MENVASVAVGVNMWFWTDEDNLEFMIQIEMWFLLVKLGLIEFDL